MPKGDHRLKTAGIAGRRGIPGGPFAAALREHQADGELCGPSRHGLDLKGVGEFPEGLDESLRLFGMKPVPGTFNGH